MTDITFSALAAFPRLLERMTRRSPKPSGTGRRHRGRHPSEAFTAIEQVCHVRDIEIEGYHVRFQRTLDEETPTLAAIDSEAVTRARPYAAADSDEVFDAFRVARSRTLDLLASLDESQFARTAVFEGYGPLTLRSLAHYLCSHDEQHLAGLQWLLGKIEARRPD